MINKSKFFDSFKKFFVLIKGFNSSIYFDNLSISYLVAKKLTYSSKNFSTKYILWSGGLKSQFIILSIIYSISPTLKYSKS